jgi:signal transduction histidine kinase
LEKVFQRFEQIETDLTRQHQGTGLGLTIAKEMVEVMGGNMTVVSAPGEGTTFSFQIAVPIPAGAQVTRPVVHTVSAPIARQG